MHEHTPNDSAQAELWQRAENVVLAVAKILGDKGERLADPVDFVARIAGVHPNDVMSARGRLRSQGDVVDGTNGAGQAIMVVNPNKEAVVQVAEQDPVWIGSIALPRQQLAQHINDQLQLDRSQHFLNVQIATIHSGTYNA